MSFEKFFQLISYAAVFCGFFSLWASGAIGLLGCVLFLSIFGAAWFLEGKKWQISEKIGTSLIVISLPVYYLGYRSQFFSFSNQETALAAILSQLILSLTAIKLLQRKSERDWIFLYLMAFFEVILAAGLSISALYLASFLLYLLVMACAIIAFEIRKTSAGVAKKQLLTNKLQSRHSGPLPVVGARRLAAASAGLIVFIFLFGLPLFFLLPRVGGAGLGTNQGKLPSTGFSETIKLGGVRRIEQSDEIAMRVRLEQPLDERDLYWRGAAFDTFDNRSWRTARAIRREPYVKIDNEFIDLDQSADQQSFTKQTIYLEPLDSSILFALPRAVRIHGNFPFINKDSYGSISFAKNAERISYTVESDRSQPTPERLRSDNRPYIGDIQNYLQLPEQYDRRIFNLALKITSTSTNRYDKAKALESYLQNNFGYTTDLKADGAEPLSDFLFNVREGHCEYFASAMAVMLRTQGIASRVATGFHGGEYNDTADITVVRQRNAHAWVEVYFPQEKAWVTFDPTPSGPASEAVRSGIAAQFNKYLEAIETFWIQYFVAYDNQEQKSLVRNAQKSMSDYQTKSMAVFDAVRLVLIEWWTYVRGDHGFSSSLIAIGYGIAILLCGLTGFFLVRWAYRKIIALDALKRLFSRTGSDNQQTIIEFYEKMVEMLAARGLNRPPFQTPLEFAYGLGIPEVSNITEKYNRVRFGQKPLTANESREIESWLEKIAGEEKSA